MFKVIHKSDVGFTSRSEITVYSTVVIEGELMFVMFSSGSWYTEPASDYIPV